MENFLVFQKEIRWKIQQHNYSIENITEKRSLLGNIFIENFFVKNIVLFEDRIVEQKFKLHQNYYSKVDRFCKFKNMCFSKLQIAEAKNTKRTGFRLISVAVVPKQENQELFSKWVLQQKVFYNKITR